MEFLDAFDDVSVSSEPVETDAGPVLLVRVLDELDHGVVLLSDAGRVFAVNRAALRECSLDSLCIVDGHVRAKNDRDHRMLVRAIGSAGMGRRSMVTMRRGDGSLSIAVIPLGGATTHAARSPSVLLAFGRRHVCAPLSMEFFAREHQITAAELSVLRGLCEGDRPAEIAAQCGVSLATIRTQLASLRRKTDSRTVVDLLHRVAALPPIVSVLADRGQGAGGDGGWSRRQPPFASHAAVRPAPVEGPVGAARGLRQAQPERGWVP